MYIFMISHTQFIFIKLWLLFFVWNARKYSSTRGICLVWEYCNGILFVSTEWNKNRTVLNLIFDRTISCRFKQNRILETDFTKFLTPIWFPLIELLFIRSKSPCEDCHFFVLCTYEPVLGIDNEKKIQIRSSTTLSITCLSNPPNLFFMKK